MPPRNPCRLCDLGVGKSNCIRCSVCLNLDHLYDLIQGLYELTQAPHNELERAIIGTGELKLVNELKRFEVPHDSWETLPDAVRDQWMKRLHKAVVKPMNTVLSSDDSISINLPGHKGKKKSRVMRKRAHKTR